MQALLKTTYHDGIDEWKKVLDINLTSTFLMSKFVVKKMLKNKSGKIINIAELVRDFKFRTSKLHSI